MTLTEEVFRAKLEEYGRPPLQPTFDDSQNAFFMRVSDLDVMPLGVECYVAVDLGEDRVFEGVVPSWAVTFQAGEPIIPGLRFELADEEYRVRLPASSIGTSTWLMTGDEIKRCEYEM